MLLKESLRHASEKSAGSDEFYAYKMARDELDDKTAVIPYSTGNDRAIVFHKKK